MGDRRRDNKKLTVKVQEVGTEQEHAQNCGSNTVVELTVGLGRQDVGETNVEDTQSVQHGQQRDHRQHRS